VGGFRAGTRARVIYNGVDVARIVRESEAPPPDGLGRIEAPLVGMVGNLDWRKNPAVLIEATPAIREAVPGVRVVLVGAFPDAESETRARQRMEALGLADVVAVTGFREPVPGGARPRPSGAARPVPARTPRGA
jgi:glycosyltransferase involved in cell wall biosynthesis